ncbi:MAG TPA: sugar phosphate isomerase/epimerase [Armatimonadota bacterium]|jgi:sugar phosphate isomerase/epimerase
MKIGVFTVLFGQKPFQEALDYIQSKGVQAVEIGTGSYPGNAHCPLDELLGSESSRKAFVNAIESRGLTLDSLSCHGNPLHPDKAFAKAEDDTFTKTIRLASLLGVERVNTFSGCPGDSDAAARPNWVTCPWPPDFTEILDWQWSEKVIPYWTAKNAFLEEHNVKACLEMHPGFVVYNPETMLKLNKAAGKNVGANFDPSHFWWQGIDPVYAIRALGDIIYHFHAKDCKIDEINTKTSGVLDTKPYGDEIHRSWVFRTVGYGHSEEAWRAIISNLRMVGYDWVISIEHEDSIMSVNEGFERAVEFLKPIVFQESPGDMWWA